MCRTKYLDDALHFFVGGGAVSAKVANYLAQIQSAVLAHASAPPQQLRHEQVVLLGAGMDTRAQRLDLPAGTKWFEVDRAEVLRVKHNLLRSMKHKVLQSTSTTVQAAGVHLCARFRAKKMAMRIDVPASGFKTFQHAYQCMSIERFAPKRWL